jgi:hypothetical protein
MTQTAEAFTTTARAGYPARTFSTKNVSRAGWDVEYVTSFGCFIPTVRTQGYPFVLNIPGHNKLSGFETLEQAERAIDALYA